MDVQRRPDGNLRGTFPNAIRVTGSRSDHASGKVNKTLLLRKQRRGMAELEIVNFSVNGEKA